MVSQTFKKGIILSVLVVIAIAIFDIISAHSGVFGTYEQYTNGEFDPSWWDVFYKFNLIMLFIIPVSYYFFAHRDLSESIALFLTSYILWFFALADVLFFLFQGKMVPSTLPWLNQHPIIGNLASIIGDGIVTRNVVFISVALGFILVYFTTKELEKI